MANLDFQTSMVLVAVSMFSALSALFLGGIFASRRSVPCADGSIRDLVERTLFVFRNKKLIDATPNALLFAGAPVKNSDTWRALCRRLENSHPGVQEALDNLAADMAPVELCDLPDGRVLAWRRHDLTFLELIAAQPGGAEPDKHDLHFLRQLADAAPVLIWSEDSAGAVVWANLPYLKLVARLNGTEPPSDPPYPALFFQKSERPPSRRCSVRIPGQTTPLWFEVESHDLESEGRLYYAIHADPVVKAEGALRNFVQTLTKTFAHLPTGLAIFDKDRQLALFNPALSDMTTLEPEWLTDRPSLYAFLDRLRENRHLPEPKDYKSWRYRIAELEKAAEQGTYEENWALPSGKTYKVTGRPHPEGAVAFLFEDITSEMRLRRQFRSELALGQSVLDCEPDAIAVFSAGEELVMSNDAYAALWGIAPDEMLARITLSESLQHWRDRCKPNSYAGQSSILGPGASNDRKPRTESVEMRTGETLGIRTSPLAQGAMLYRFTLRIPKPPGHKDTGTKKILAQA